MIFELQTPKEHVDAKASIHTFDTLMIVDVMAEGLGIRHVRSTVGYPHA